MAATIDPDLDGLLSELAEVTELQSLCDAIRGLVTTEHALNRLPTIIACLAGIHDGNDSVGAIALAIQNLTNAHHQTAITELPTQQQKEIQQTGEQTAFTLLDPDLRDQAAETSAALNHRPGRIRI
ncbi:hypothetical protein [Streptomyces sp. NPDC007074]|uniref:hypothetical protein n=1 Tax=Streptomyces sp. NPDC007074 TaxID=3156764 RepID=UPI0033F5E790